MTKKVEISHRTIIFTLFLLVLIWLFYQIRHILVGLLASLVLMAAINPLVDKFEKLKIPRVLGILLVYIMVLTVLGLTLAGLVPPLVDQTSTLISRLPQYGENLGIPPLGQKILEAQINQLGSLPANLVKISVSVFSHFISILAVLVITFYLLLERKNLDRRFHLLFGLDGEKKAEKLLNKIEKQLGGWVRAELALMAIVGAMSYIGLRLLGIDFALPLALLAGLLEVIPNIGPIIAAVPAALAGLALSPLMGLAVVALYFLIQQIENTVIVPQVMAKEAGVNPLVTIISLAIGFKLGGVVGALLAVPVVLLFKIIASEIFATQRLSQL